MRVQADWWSYIIGGEIQPTTEYTSGYTWVVCSSAGAPDWIYTVHLDKESDYKPSDDIAIK